MLWDWRLNTHASLRDHGSSPAYRERGARSPGRLRLCGSRHWIRDISTVVECAGWVTGARISYHNHRAYQRIVSTSDGGRTWRTDYTTIP